MQTRLCALSTRHYSLSKSKHWPNTTASGRSHERVRGDVIAITAPVANRAARGRANYKWLGSRDTAQ